MIYDESIEFFLDSAVDNVKSWFENQVTVMNVFQKSVVDPVDNPDHIKNRILWADIQNVRSLFCASGTKIFDLV